MKIEFIKFSLYSFLIYIFFWFLSSEKGMKNLKFFEVFFLWLTIVLFGVSIFFVIYDIIDRMTMRFKRNRCVRCGKKAEPGMIYCKEHLYEAKREVLEERYKGEGLGGIKK